MKKMMVFLIILSVKFVFSQDSIDVNENKKKIYEYIISDFQNENNKKSLFVNIDFNQELPDKFSMGIAGNRVMSVFRVNNPYLFECENSKIYSNLGHDFHYVVSKENIYLDEFNFLDIKTPIDKWLDFNLFEMKCFKNKEEVKIYIPVIFENINFISSINSKHIYIYEFIYKWNKDFEYVKRLEF